MKTRAYKIAEFDATALCQRDDVLFTKLDVLVIKSPELIESYAKRWLDETIAMSSNRPQFNWPAVFSFNRRAALLAIGSVHQAEALALLRNKHVIDCSTGKRGPMTYVAFLEVAPWNKPSLASRQFGGLGPLMLRIASAWSENDGHGGVVGLHALSSAEPFYEKIGLRQIGCPNEHHELYFELARSDAKSFRSKGGVSL